MKSMPVTKNPPGGAFQKGGNNPMHKWSGSGTQEPGQAAQEGTGGKDDFKPKAGGNVAFVSDNEKKGREMTAKAGGNQFGAGPQEPGQSASAGKRQDGFAHGGDTHMHGNTGSQVARPGQSSQ